MAEPMIQVDNLTYRYDLRQQKQTISSVSFTVEKGEWVAIVGRNGSGKSTLAHLLVGLRMPQAGTVSICGQTLAEETKWDIRRKVGIVFQNPDNQFIGTTVQDDVAFGLENLNMDFNEMKKRVEKALKMVGMYDHRLDDPSRLSGGQKQRVAIAGALVLEPEILIFDESFVMIDPKSRRELLVMMQQLKEQNHLTVLSITHDMNEAQDADRMIVLDEGQIKNIGTPKEIFTNERHLTPPFSEQLRRTLERRGADVPETYMSQEEMMCWLWK